MNVELLRQVQKAILDEPLRINMDNWSFTSDQQEVLEQQPRCGTVGCIAGWTIAIRFNLFDSKGEDMLAGYVGSYEIDAKDELNLSPVQANRLFYPNLWPEKFRQALKIERAEGLHDELCPTCGPKLENGNSWNIGMKVGTLEYAQAVAARIDHFIATEGAE